MKSKKFHFLLLIVFFCSTSCISIRKGSTKGAELDYESFFINDSTTQYFIKPLDFIGDKQFSCDFTFRRSGSVNSETTMNFSCFSTFNQPIDTVYLITSSNRYLIINSKLLYKERIEKSFHYRYSTTISFGQLKEFFQSPQQGVLIDQSYLKMKPATRKKINRIKTNLFEFELE